MKFRITLIMLPLILGGSPLNMTDADSIEGIGLAEDISSVLIVVGFSSQLHPRIFRYRLPSSEQGRASRPTSWNLREAHVIVTYPGSRLCIPGARQSAVSVFHLSEKIPAIWDATTGKLIRPPWLRATPIARRGDYVAYLDGNNWLEWQIGASGWFHKRDSKGVVLKEAVVPHLELIAYCATTGSVAVLTKDGNLHIWNEMTHQKSSYDISAHRPRGPLKFTAGGASVACACYDGIVVVSQLEGIPKIPDHLLIAEGSPLQVGFQIMDFTPNLKHLVGRQRFKQLIWAEAREGSLEVRSVPKGDCTILEAYIGTSGTQVVWMDGFRRVNWVDVVKGSARTLFSLPGRR